MHTTVTRVDIDIPCFKTLLFTTLLFIVITCASLKRAIQAVYHVFIDQGRAHFLDAFFLVAVVPFAVKSLAEVMFNVRRGKMMGVGLHIGAVV